MEIIIVKYKLFLGNIHYIVLLYQTITSET